MSEALEGLKSTTPIFRVTVICSGIKTFAGDGALDIFFREVQLAWEELYPFADKKALKAARLVGLPGSPQTLAAVCGDRQRYVRLIAALVRIELSKTHHEY